MDGSAWISGECDQRVLRGGSWINSPGPSFRPPRQEYSRLPGRRQRIPYCPDVHPVNLHLFTSGVQGAKPPGDFRSLICRIRTVWRGNMADSLIDRSRETRPAL